MIPPVHHGSTTFREQTRCFAACAVVLCCAFGCGPSHPRVGPFAAQYEPCPQVQEADVEYDAAEVDSLPGLIFGVTEVSQGVTSAVLGRNLGTRATGCWHTLPAIAPSELDVVELANRLSVAHGLVPVYSVDGRTIHIEPSADGFRVPTPGEWSGALESGGAGSGTCVFGNEPDLEMRDQQSLIMTSSHPITFEVEVFVECRDGYYGLAPVRSFQGDRNGVHDLVGNAQEWCWEHDGDAVGRRFVCGTSFVDLEAEARPAQGRVAFPGVRLVRPM